jgi:catechol 2,3-dioxygenase-like lactoylglutathione lyase family enzyme
MKVMRIVSNVDTRNLAAAEAFYGKVLGLRVLMDHGWIKTFGSDQKATTQISFAAEGGSGTPVPQLSIEVDDLEEAVARCRAGGYILEYGPAQEPWGVRRFFVRDPFGQLVNILMHI